MYNFIKKHLEIFLGLERGMQQLDPKNKSKMLSYFFYKITKSK